MVQLATAVSILSNKTFCCLALMQLDVAIYDLSDFGTSKLKWLAKLAILSAGINVMMKALFEEDL